MNCPICGSKKARQIRTPYHYAASGLDNVYLLGVPYMRCSSCDDDIVVIPHEQQLLDLIAVDLVRSERRLDSNEVRYLRKNAEWTQQELGDSLGVDRVTVNRWEAGEQAPPPHSDLAIRVVWVRRKMRLIEDEVGGRGNDPVFEQIRSALDHLSAIVSRLGLQQNPRKRVVIDVERMALVA